MAKLSDLKLVSESAKSSGTRKTKSVKRKTFSIPARTEEKFYPLSNKDIMYEKDMQGYLRLTARDRNGYLHKMAFSQMSKSEAVKRFKAHHKALYEGKSRP